MADLHVTQAEQQQQQAEQQQQAAQAIIIENFRELKVAFIHDFERAFQLIKNKKTIGFELTEFEFSDERKEFMLRWFKNYKAMISALRVNSPIPQGWRFTGRPYQDEPMALELYRYGYPVYSRFYSIGEPITIASIPDELYKML
jgi:hypothetical protein